MCIFIDFWKLETENSFLHVFSFFHKLSFKNSFYFLSILNYQISFLVSKIENYFWNQKIREKGQLPNIPLIFYMKLTLVWLVVIHQLNLSLISIK